MTVGGSSPSILSKPIVGSSGQVIVILVTGAVLPALGEFRQSCSVVVQVALNLEDNRWPICVLTKIFTIF